MTGKYRGNIYNYSVYEAYKFVIDFYRVKYMPYDEIEKLSVIKDIAPNPNYINAGKFLIEHMSLRELDSLYRQDLIKFLKKRNVKTFNLIPEQNKNYEKV